MDFVKKLILGFSVIPSLLYANHLALFLSGGPNSSRLHNEQFVVINDFVANAYQTTEKNQWQGFWGGGITHTFEGILSHSNLSLGLAGYSIHLGKVQGKEYPFINDGVYDALDYSFHVKNHLLMLESRLSYVFYNWQPFALIGIGKAWNRLEHYNEIAADPSSSATPLTPGFGNHTHQDFAYELGLGVQHPLFEDKLRKMTYTASLGYRYFNLGQGKSGALPEQTSTDRLSIKNLYTQCIVFSIEASFN
ncbi:outer membrane protein [Legionella fairfieldensis]|uniref:outer membrane protein n=1 Tax=Legionella fairfieldensis TaxID=45064 RepID=UPI00048DB8F9|nr:hypothetical protein [Legionella fairfieldensis]